MQFTFGVEVVVQSGGVEALELVDYLSGPLFSPSAGGPCLAADGDGGFPEAEEWNLAISGGTALVATSGLALTPADVAIVCDPTKQWDDYVPIS